MSEEIRQPTTPKPFENNDMFRLTRAKALVDVTANTLRTYHANGLPFYRRGRAVFVSKKDLVNYIRDPNCFKNPDNSTEETSDAPSNAPRNISVVAINYCPNCGCDLRSMRTQLRNDELRQRGTENEN